MITVTMPEWFAWVLTAFIVVYAGLTIWSCCLSHMQLKLKRKVSQVEVQISEITRDILKRKKEEVDEQGEGPDEVQS